jgi:uncharacterized protein YkwD
MIRFTAALIALLLCFAACSRSFNPVLPPDAKGTENQPSVTDNSILDFTPGSDIDPESEDLSLWAAVNIVLDPSSGKATIEDRSADVALRHYKVSYFLTAPRCTDCISVLNYEMDQEHSVGHVVVSLRNPTELWGYDVRGVIRIPTGNELKLLNPDGYTSLFQMPGYISPAPFRTFATTEDGYGFAPGSSHFAQFDIKTSAGSDPTEFTLLVTAGHPSAPGDVSYIGQFRQMGQLMSGGGTAMISIDVRDLQNDISGVCLHAQALGSGDVWLTPSNGRWETQLANATGAPGIYDLVIDAHSPNSQSAVTSQIYRAVVFSDFTAFRSQLLTLLNKDRSDNGLSALELDPLLCTVAQGHAQDMIDNNYFSHYNLDGWSPFDRMSYYGVDFGSAGENIAAGQDSPSAVETAWMNSPGHKANILGSSYRKVGLGIVQANGGNMYAPGYYWVQAFTD